MSNIVIFHDYKEYYFNHIYEHLKNENIMGLVTMEYYKYLVDYFFFLIIHKIVVCNQSRLEVIDVINWHFETSQWTLY